MAVARSRIAQSWATQAGRLTNRLATSALVDGENRLASAGGRGIMAGPPRIRLYTGCAVKIGPARASVPHRTIRAALSSYLKLDMAP